eukprot:6287328-Alexandrium_andersonii.AAC.1
MSASLVGSEMCIRDRRARLTYGADLERVKSEKQRELFLVSGECEVLKKAVSYTHLTLPTICSV